MSPRGLAENEFHVVKRDGASTSRPIDIPPRSGLAKAPANARKCSPGRFQFLSRVLSRGKIRSILENLRQSCDRFRSLLAFTAKYRLVRTGSGVERGREGFRGWENSLLERILFLFFFFWIFMLDWCRWFFEKRIDFWWNLLYFREIFVNWNLREYYNIVISFELPAKTIDNSRRF